MLVHLWEKHEEVPFIAVYRKESAGDLRSLREDDVPRTTTSSEATDAYPVGTIQVRAKQPMHVNGTAVLLAAYGHRRRHAPQLIINPALLSGLEVTCAPSRTADTERCTYHLCAALVHL